jgi:hypothetical protein
MTTKYLLPDAEGRQFCDELNKLIDRYGAAVTASSRVDERTGQQVYMLVFSKGTKRHTLQSELPFSWEGPQEILLRVKDWCEGTVGGDPYWRRWTTDTRYAD